VHLCCSQALLGTPPEEFARWPVLFVGTRPNNAWLVDQEDLTNYFSGHKGQFGTQAAAGGAAGGPTDAVLVDPSKLMVAILHEDRGGSAARRQPPSNSRYVFEKPVKIYA
jgi:ubiquitin carboxyl-terminal hydrolase 7